MEFFHSENDSQSTGHRNDIDAEFSLLEHEFKTSPYFSPMAAPLATSMPNSLYDADMYHGLPMMPLQIPDILTPQTLPQDVQYDLTSNAYPPICDPINDSVRHDHDHHARTSLGLHDPHDLHDLHDPHSHERSHSSPNIHNNAKRDSNGNISSNVNSNSNANGTPGGNGNGNGNNSCETPTSGGTTPGSGGIVAGAGGPTTPSSGANSRPASIQQPRSRTASGKVSKQSPPMRWRTNQNQFIEDEFILGEPAMDVSDPSVKNEELDDKLRNAIATTQRVVTRSNSRHSSVANSRRTSVVSLRQSAPWIRPRQSVSADPSPLLASQDGANDPLDDVMSKSNYQNIVDGTHHHLGYQTVDRVTSELMSKKTVHKLAEQERRNRMNNAIVDLNKVLSLGNDKTANSKAATVEKATKYILELQQKLAELELKLAEKSVSSNASTDREKSV